MVQELAPAPTGEINSIGRKAWTAYLWLGIISALLLLIGVPMAFLMSVGTGFLALVAVVAFIAYKTLLIRSYHLYTNSMGVWVYSGVLPWNRGVRGVKWRDLDEALYSQGLGSWLFKSHSLRLGHRFTRSSEILLSDMAHGDKCAMAINSQHQKLVRENKLT